MAHASRSGGATSLARGAIGLREVLFQSVTSMAPAGAVALSIAAGATYAGGALPLAVLLALVACLLVASSIGQLAKHLPSAGSIYTYPAEAIHPALGFLVGWGYALVEALIGPLTTVIFGYLVARCCNSECELAVHHHLGHLHDRRDDPGRRAELPRRSRSALGPARSWARSRSWCSWPWPSGSSSRPGRTTPCQRLHPALRHDQGLQGLLRHRRGLDLHGPGVHRLRGVGAAGRGGQQPAPHDPASRW